MSRDERGRFVKGETGNPNGRPPKEREVRFYQITLESVTFQDWREIVERAVADAKRGDSAARKWLADYLIGTPEQRFEVTGANGGAIEVDFSRLTDEQLTALVAVAESLATEGRASAP